MSYELSANGNASIDASVVATGTRRSASAE